MPSREAAILVLPADEFKDIPCRHVIAFVRYIHIALFVEGQSLRLVKPVAIEMVSTLYLPATIGYHQQLVDGGNDKPFAGHWVFGQCRGAEPSFYLAVDGPDL